MKREDDAGYTKTLAFVVMPDHLHWLFQLIGDRSLTTSVNTVKSYSTRRINVIVKRQGRLWQKGFYDRAIRKEEDLVSVARYIVANPVRAGFVKSIRLYSLWDATWL
jgi:REP element-mobilizing transposase RayT